jgi:hypothetical protein
LEMAKAESECDRLRLARLAYGCCPARIQVKA